MSADTICRDHAAQTSQDRPCQTGCPAGYIAGAATRVAGDVIPPCHNGPLYRVPCCCEVAHDVCPATASDHSCCHCCFGCSRDNVPYQHHQGRPYSGGGVGVLPVAHGSRLCAFCVPEREQLREYEHHEKRQRYLAVRADRENLLQALGGKVVGTHGESRGHYKSNMTHLMRHARGTIHQQAAMAEQQRRRQELRREVEERRRELGGRGYRQLVGPVEDRRTSRVVARPRKETPAYYYTPVPHCGTGQMRQHSLARNTVAHVAPRAEGKCVAAHKERRAAAPRVTNNEDNVPENTQPPKKSKATDARPAQVSRSTSFIKKGSEPNQHPQVVLQCCCHAVCRCRPCKCFAPCRCNNNVPAKDPGTAPSAVVAKSEKEEPSAAKTPRPTNECKKSVANSPVARSSSVKHGRKIFITDHAHSDRRSQVINRLEEDGYLRPVPPTTRSPSAPLAEKAKKWETTRSTSAHHL